MEAILVGIQCDLPNINGRIYPRNLVEEMVEEINSKPNSKIIYIGEANDQGSFDMSKSVAIIKSAEITEDDRVKVYFEPLTFQTFSTEGYFSQGCELRPYGFGRVKDNVVTEYKFTAVSMKIPEGEFNGN